MDKIHFEKLTPNKNVDLGIYEKALDFVFENNEIKNIAITGSYSSGKSSIVESYKQQVSDKKFLHISLANFEESDSHELINVKESVLEGKILNQLLHQIDVSKIPQTNFKIKKTESDKNILKTTALIIAFIMSGLHIFYNSKWIEFVQTLKQFYSLGFLQITTKGISLFFSGVIFLATFTVGVFNLIKIQKNRNIFKKFNFNGNEIEILENSEESYFDKYLNEVLYIFENSNADVIVFEDIDRYNVNQIFQRLREINTLVNSKRELSKREPLRFFYLVKDDIFISKDRTKFFDFIIPIVPVIDSSNSYDQFISHFKKENIFEKFDENFLQGISLYVDDMRILKNIYNEFIIYYNRIGTTEQDYNKLLAIIVYKNIFPRDFSDTQINIGFISTIFTNKDKFIEDEIQEIDKKINELEKLIRNCEEEHLKSIDELKKIYSNYNWRPPRLNDNDPEFIERKKSLELIESNKIDEIKNEINKLKQKITKLKNASLSEIITRDNVCKVFDVKYVNFIGKPNNFDEIKSSQYFDLIKYLIWNGYIDETYEDYMTYFYPNSITRNDKMFLRSIADKKAKEWTYSLTNPKLVLSRLREVDFDEIEILNFDLFGYILDTQEQNKKYLVRLIAQLKEIKQFEFMKEYFTYTNNISIYVKSINKYWSTFLEQISSESEFTYTQRKEYILETLYYSDEEDIQEINKEQFLSNIISSDNLFLNIDNPKVDKLIEKFINLNIKFEILNFEESNRELFDLVYENKLYKLNYENISTILKYIFVVNEDDIKHRNYSIIMENSNSKLLEYVNENIEIYTEIIIDNCDGKILDNQDVALKLINNKDIKNSTISKYIMSLDTELMLLEDIKSIELWDLLLQNSKVKYSIDNILSYYFDKANKINEILVNFINSNDIKFEFLEEDIERKFGDNSALNIFKALVSSEDIKIEIYKNILENFKFKYPSPDIEIENLSQERIKILIDLDKFEVSSGNIQYLQMNYNELFIYFIQKNIKIYVQEISNLPKLQKDELVILLSSEIDDDFKVELVSNFDGTLSISEINCSDSVVNFIINNNFDKSELIHIMNLYNNASDLIKESIVNLCEKFINIILENKTCVNYNLLIEILSNNNISKEIKLQLLNNSMDRLFKGQVEMAVKSIGLSEHEKIFTKGRPKFEISEINKEFLSKCKNKRWISNFYEDNGILKISRQGLGNIIFR